ncbi:MAG: SDR family oxidoreductase [Hyphomonadaceae bacterium]|jgi:nucleoside-diphosphate-sugar epimerase|nr:SDR family oxidoreductase [Hyphomonadaceae bacterium]
MRLFCFGYGYSAESLARRLSARDIAVAGTRTGLGEMPTPGVELVAYKGDTPSPRVRELLADTTHVLVSIPPDLEGDVVLRHYRDDLAALTDLAWIGYLSTVGVYGDHKGAWVDEASPTRPTSERSLRRLQAERAWLDFCRDTGRRVEIFRLSGIYGPGRSVIDNLKAGTARRIVKPGQVFNRIHVDDIARVLAAAIDSNAGHRIYNVSDDEPAPPEDVVAYAAELLGVPVPPALPIETAGLGGMAASFWAESKRVRNVRIRQDLGVELLYPTYREGLRALAAN